MMPIVKMQNRKVACSRPKGIQWYIEDKVPGRCLAKEFLNMLAWRTSQWAKEFDRRRMIEGNDRPYHGKPAVQYVHAEISPDPRDAVTVEEMVSFAREWAAHWFGDDFEPGKLGCFQVAIGIHDDNENGIMHAHVVVNNTDLLTGKRLHFNRDDNRAAQHTAQDLARERGWHYFDNTADRKWVKAEAGLPLSKRRASLSVGTPPTIAERRMAERGERIWKDSVRDKVNASRCISRTEEEFADACEAMGMHVRKAGNGDLVYTIDWDGESKQVAGSNLGKGWKGAGVEGRETLAMKMNSTNAKALRGNVLKAFSEMRTWEVQARGLSEHEIASTLMTMHRWNIWDANGFDAAIAKCKKRLGATEGRENRAIKASYAKLLQAKETAAKMDLLKGVRKAEQTGRRGEESRTSRNDRDNAARSSSARKMRQQREAGRNQGGQSSRRGKAR